MRRELKRVALDFEWPIKKVWKGFINPHYDKECARCCDGDGSHWESEEAEKLCDEWTEQEPPTGLGYQMWETVSEGSPWTNQHNRNEGFVAREKAHGQ